MSGQHIFSMVNLAKEIVDDTTSDSRLWIELTDEVRQRPLLFDLGTGLLVPGPDAWLAEMTL